MTFFISTTSLSPSTFPGDRLSSVPEIQPQNIFRMSLRRYPLQGVTRGGPTPAP